MELTQLINGCRIKIRRCNPTASHRVAVISHGRFLPLRTLFSNATIDTLLPPDVVVNWYVRHGETISSHKVMGLYERLHRGDKPAPIKDYSVRDSIKNYTLYAEPNIERVCVPRPGGYCDIICPIDTITTHGILQAVSTGELPYREIHFLSCRATRVTLSAF